MKDRDVEREVPRDRFVATLRRIADALEANDSFRIQVSGLRLTVPENAELSVEHEVDNNDHELELQLKWSE